MSIYQPDLNPAYALYRYWHSILENASTAIPWGCLGWGLELDHATGVINFGYLNTGYAGCSVYSYFRIEPTLRFQFAGAMHGGHRRNVIANATFLGWSWLSGRYQWYVKTGPMHGLPSRGPVGGWTRACSDWQNPIRYVSEDLLGCRTWRQDNTWVRLESVDGEWRIVPARTQLPAGMYGGGYRSLRQKRKKHRELRERFDRYERLVERRYRVVQNRYLTDMGMTPIPLSAQPPRVQSGRETVQGRNAVALISALLDVSQPAKTTRLTRPKEAENGNHLVAASDV